MQFYIRNRDWALWYASDERQTGQRCGYCDGMRFRAISNNPPASSVE